MKRIILAVVLTALIGITAAYAQDTEPVSRIAYYTAADSNGVQQVYQLLLGGQTRQITHAASDVITFGVAYDGLAVAYISEAQLWLQPIHTEEAQALTTVQTAQFFMPPVFSQDGQYIAYADGGVWLLDLGTRETRQLLADTDLVGNNETSEFRRYQPQQFVIGADGRAAKLVVDVGVWEWNSVGVYDLETGVFTQLEGQDHTNILPLESGFVLVYGNSAVAGEPALSVAPGIDQINEAVEVVKFADLTDKILFAEQAVEIAPQLVRVYGQTITETPGEFGIFYVDYSLVSGAGTVNFITIAAPEGAMYGGLSPDGAVLPVYIYPLYRDYGTIFGALQLRDMASGEILAVDLPETVGVFAWQP